MTAAISGSKIIAKTMTARSRPEKRRQPLCCRAPDANLPNCSISPSGVNGLCRPVGQAATQSDPPRHAVGN